MQSWRQRRQITTEALAALDAEVEAIKSRDARLGGATHCASHVQQDHPLRRHGQCELQRAARLEHIMRMALSSLRLCVRHEGRWTQHVQEMLGPRAEPKPNFNLGRRPQISPTLKNVAAIANCFPRCPADMVSSKPHGFSSRRTGRLFDVTGRPCPVNPVTPRNSSVPYCPHLG